MRVTTESQIQTQSPASNASRYLPVLLILFAGSGCSALIYEIVWYQLLQLAIGSSAVSLAVVLATFMGGLCIGSVALPRLNLKDQHPLRLYAFLEVGIALYGLLVLAGMPLLDRVYIAGASHGLSTREAIRSITSTRRSRRSIFARTMTRETYSYRGTISTGSRNWRVARRHSRISSSATAHSQAAFSGTAVIS